MTNSLASISMLLIVRFQLEKLEVVSIYLEPKRFSLKSWMQNLWLELVEDSWLLKSSLQHTLRMKWEKSTTWLKNSWLLSIQKAKKFQLRSIRMRDFLCIETMLQTIGSRQLQVPPRLLLPKMIQSKAFLLQLERNQLMLTNFSNDSVFYYKINYYN